MALIDEIPPSLLATWEQRVAGSVRVREPRDVARIAERCAAAEWCGEKYVSVWHMAADFYGTKCHCHRCETGR